MIEHELYTPLMGIRGCAQLLKRRGAQPAWAADAIVAEADRLAGRLRDLLAALALEEGRWPLRPAPTALDALARAAAAAARARTDRHAVRVEAPPDPVVGAWDREALALGHLLLNAVDYAPDGGEVRVRVEADADGARVAVVDQGVGIPPGELPRVFERFYRVAAAGPAVRARQGQGLGLHLCRLVAGAHGGALAAESAPGAGSTFSLALPYAPPGAATAGPQMNILQ